MNAARSWAADFLAEIRLNHEETGQWCGRLAQLEGAVMHAGDFAYYCPHAELRRTAYAAQDVLRGLIKKYKERP